MAGVHPILAGLACRCPSCGKGALFRSYLKLNTRCPACDFDLAKADAGDGPAVFVILICGAVACFGLLFTEMTYHPPVWVELVIWFPAAALLCLAALPPFKGALLAAQFLNKASEVRPEDLRHGE